MLFFLAIPIGGALGHSWLDCIGPNVPYHGGAQYFGDEFYEYCAGYGRGYPGRMNRDINTIFTVQIDGRGAPNPNTTNVCGEPGRTINYSEKYPMMRAKVGTTVKLWYQLDNHRRATNVYVYGFPGKQEITYRDQLKATPLLTHGFTDNCLDLGNNNSWCWALWTLPLTLQPGVNSFLWNWKWDQNRVGEEYNTCFDIEILPTSSPPKTDFSPNPKPSPISNPKPKRCNPRL